VTGPGVRRTGPESDEVTRWITEHAHPLALLDAAAPPRGLEPLDSIVDQAIVVGLARPTHGAHELSTLTQRILRYLVETFGFRTLAIEEDWTTGIEIDRHLRSGHGDPQELLQNASQQWQNEELLDVLRWLRGWNEQHPDDHVRFVGLDVSSVRAVAHDAIVDHVRRRAPDRLDELEAHLSVTRPTAGIRDHTERYASLADKGPLLEHAHRTFDLVEGLPAGDDQAFALQHARVIVAYHELHAIQSAARMTYLEARLADNLIWWHDHTGHKILYWSGSHSAVGDARRVDFGPNRSSETGRNAGSYLRQHFGTRYRSGGLTVHHGTIRLDATTQDVPEPPSGRPDAVLGEVGLDRFLLNLRSDHPPSVRDWLEAPATFRLIGPSYRPMEDAGHHMRGGSLADWFDFIIHHHQVTPTRSLA
jgi:erythromycin esterase